jgi:3-oxoacyl-[acyl-carrier protein] reductase
MNFGLAGKKALVCAASKGIGKATAAALAAEGVELFLCARGPEALAETVREITEAGFGPVHSLSCDLTNADSRNELIAKAKDSIGSIDVLIHNVGGPKPSTAEGTSLNDWDNGFEQLFNSVAHLNNAFVPEMKKNKWGRILCITSLSVIEPIPNLAVSNAMRAATTAMLKTLADELAPHNITVNCVAPGVIHTERTEERIATNIERTGNTREVLLEDYVKSVPMGRLGTSHEVANVVAFLASEQASYVTGSTICVDGGKRRSTV